MHIPVVGLDRFAVLGVTGVPACERHERMAEMMGHSPSKAPIQSFGQLLQQTVCIGDVLGCLAREKLIAQLVCAVALASFASVP